MKTFRKLVHTVLSMSGFVPENMNPVRFTFMISSFLLTTFVLPDYKRLDYAIIYFMCGTSAYVLFVFSVLRENGLRLKLIEKFGERKAYLHYEAILGFLFFHNSVALTFMSQTTSYNIFWATIPELIILILSGILFIVGMVVKIWSAYVVGTPIYYWKDMFLGRKVCEFVETGPYKYLTNPMYGIGQIQVYAVAIYYGSTHGLLFGVINQALVFVFYFLVEKPFIYRTYLQPKEVEV
ncbi:MULTISPECIES: methyltransferase [unclassified Arcicella]|uniref:methyltransferase n=1 Tax=unclassified Arcicella TaxID=2644986 RepID=UPI00285C50C4|nr:MULTISPECIES: methyltransferase [unclassified Arcicella]MDR6563718.1 protein-S-isoprenylcysteine O-methyltransferase Ste14 [Arcicella sp. BE51]MDR6813598.1 protein-S-isoprenylcysteine O-methyltransferase Ste14 [Arcicella sp. BE140]MDR6824910.1 protein-S-isoprenylcysteine O-methyltransferase Ste14 [Arcicella sp. BE139]